jgi:hypothetical protein
MIIALLILIYKLIYEIIYWILKMKRTRYDPVHDEYTEVDEQNEYGNQGNKPNPSGNNIHDGPKRKKKDSEEEEEERHKVVTDYKAISRAYKEKYPEKYKKYLERKAIREKARKLEVREKKEYEAGKPEKQLKELDKLNQQREALEKKLEDEKNRHGFIHQLTNLKSKE